MALVDKRQLTHAPLLRDNDDVGITRACEPPYSREAINGHRKVAHFCVIISLHECADTQ